MVEAAFNRLKEYLTSPQVLCLPDISQQFMVECDACGMGIDVVLFQNNRLIAYFSEPLEKLALRCHI